jgi:radical SAM-linked protein
MKIAFGPALPVGTAGEREYFDIWLRGYVAADRALERLRGALPADLQALDARYVSDREPSLTAGTLLGEYDVRVEGEEVGPERVQAALDAVMRSGELVVEHKGKTKVFDLARSLPKEPRVSEVDGQVHITMAVRMGPEGSLRPDVLLRASFDAANLRVAAVEVTRTGTFVETEEGVWSRPA